MGPKTHKISKVTPLNLTRKNDFFSPLKISNDFLSRTPQTNLRTKWAIVLTLFRPFQTLFDPFRPKSRLFDSPDQKWLKMIFFDLFRLFDLFKNPKNDSKTAKNPKNDLFPRPGPLDLSRYTSHLALTLDLTRSSDLTPPGPLPTKNSYFSLFPKTVLLRYLCLSTALLHVLKPHFQTFSDLFDRKMTFFHVFASFLRQNLIFVQNEVPPKVMSFALIGTLEKWPFHENRTKTSKTHSAHILFDTWIW